MIQSNSLILFHDNTLHTNLLSMKLVRFKHDSVMYLLNVTNLISKDLYLSSQIIWQYCLYNEDRVLHSDWVLTFRIITLSFCLYVFLFVCLFFCFGLWFFQLKQCRIWIFEMVFSKYVRVKKCFFLRKKKC